MSLRDIMSSRGVNRQIGNIEVTPEMVQQYMPQLRRLISFWRCYNDKFVDYLCSLNPNNTFEFYFYQRVYLRACSRYKYVFATFPRAYSKSFLAVMCLMIRCVLYPGEKVFVVSGGKEQSAGIVTQKVNEICRLIPAFSREIVWSNRGATGTERTKQTKDSVAFSFRNGSVLENVAASEHTRGRRFHSGLTISSL